MLLFKMRHTSSSFSFIIHKLLSGPQSMTNLPTFSHEVRFRMISVCKRSDDVGGFINVIV